MRKGLFALLILLFLLASCNRVTSPREEMPEGILYQDDFEIDSENWLLESDLSASSSYNSGRLQLDISSPNLIAWAELIDRKFDDFVLEVDATQLAGPDDNSYGVIFRMKNLSAYYRFDISGDGYYALSRRDEDGSDGGHWTWITGDWLASPAIHQGNSSNKIKIIAEGSHFSFYVNNQLVAEADDSAYRSGLIGLNAGAFDQAGVSIGFDNLIVSKIE